MGGFLGSTIFVEHVDRMSNDMASLADELSRRESSKCPKTREVLDRALYRPTEGFLLKWLENPCSGVDLSKGL